MTATTHDITTRADCEQLVRAFYSRAFLDELLGPIFVDVAKLDLTKMVLDAGCRTPDDAVGYLQARFLSTPLDADVRKSFAGFLETELGTADLPSAATFAEDPLRLLLHLILSRPEYQLG